MYLAAALPQRRRAAPERNLQASGSPVREALVTAISVS